MQTSEMTLYQKGEQTLRELQEKAKTLQVNDNTVEFAGETLAIAKRLAVVLDDERLAKADPPYRIYKEINDQYNLLIKPCKEIATKIENLIAAYNRAKREEAERQKQEYERKVREVEVARLAEERRIREEQERQIREAEQKRLAEEKRIREESERQLREAQAKARAEGAKKGELERLRREAEEKRLAEERRAKEESERLQREQETKRQLELLQAQQSPVIAPPLPMEAPKEKIATTFGSVKIKERWMFEETDIVQVPREYLMIDEKKVKAAINAKENPVRNIPGLRIYPEA